MSKYYHGVRVEERETEATALVEGTAGLQVIIGTSPVNLAENPYAAAEKPIIARSFEEAQAALGYSTDYKKYTLCQSMDACFHVFAITPVIFINVLNPKKHTKDNPETEYPVSQSQVKMNINGVLLDSIVIKNGSTNLTPDTDYILSFDSEGHVIVTLLLNSDDISVLNIKSKSIDPDAVTREDVIGGFDARTGTETGMEAIRQVYPRYGLTPGLLLAPGWSQDPVVGAAIAAKTEEINGVYSCQCIVDLDTEKAKKYTDCGKIKEESGFTDKNQIVLWPKVKIGDKTYYYSAIYAALIAYQDAINDDIPCMSPSNKLLKTTGTVLEDETEITLDSDQAAVLNGQGIVTAINDSGWRAWGNNTACYPENKDSKDRWITSRRFFSWWGNSFILTYKKKVDNPANKVLIESICDSENIRGNSLVAQQKCAGARIEFRADENTVENLINGKLRFRQYLAPYPPAEDILNVLEFDPSMLETALNGGE